MTQAPQLRPLTVSLAIRMQFFQTFLLLVSSALGIFLSIWGPERGTPHKERFLNTIVRFLFPGLLALCTGILLVVRNRFGWWLAVGWNLIAIYGTAAAFLPYVWALFLILLVAPSLAIGCLFTRSTRSYFALLSPTEAAQHSSRFSLVDPS
jgi:hypothetical protein